MKNIIENILKAEKPRYKSLAFFLYSLSLVYGIVLFFRRTAYVKGVVKSKKLPCVIVSVGNLTAGGSGKTPMTIYLAGLLTRNGYRVSIISRGYKGGFEKNGGIVSDGKTIFASPSEAGDEPYMMAKRTGLPVICGKNRYASGLEAVKLGTDIVIMDDGFQHLALQRDINIVLMDWEKPLGNGYIIPRGLMREGLSALSDADAVVMTRSLYPAIKNEKLKKELNGKSVFYSRHRQYVSFCSSEYEKIKNVFVVSGIADNSGFIRGIESAGLIVSGYLSFDDHHNYSASDYKNIVNGAIASGADTIVTTEKDHAKLAAFSEDIPGNGKGWLVLGVDHDFGRNRKEFEGWILGKVKNCLLEKGLNG
ncbi:tetraacyldisaccharide 4'-kinase [Desulforegula conservatrix]|uniref:tetraacyldisaccharide 4'-kinase n=1 Tax=Desulforegula conservatrix TaxID=153026 RepID=UPI00042222B6|nr:tetraacyldisaccharide 4'-kinase [Desulforegula conservatrix]